MPVIYLLALYCPWGSCGGDARTLDLWGFCGDAVVQEAVAPKGAGAPWLDADLWKLCPPRPGRLRLAGQLLRPYWLGRHRE